MSGYILFIIAILASTASVIFLHYISPRIGFTPLLFFVAGMTAILSFSTPTPIFIEPIQDITLIIPGNIFVPIILLAILILYIANGTQAAQQAIYGVAGVNLLALGGLLLFTTFAHSADNVNGDVLFTTYSPDYRQFFAGSLVFIFDMFVIAIVYQGIKNAFPQVALWIASSVALLIALWMDSVLFYLLGSVGTDRFLDLLPGDIANKTIAGVIISLPVSYYLNRIANELPEFADHASRSTFDVLRSTVTHLREALRRSESELRESKINFQQLTEHIDEIFWLVDPKKRKIYYVSPAFETIIGLSREAFYADDAILMTVVHPEDQERVRKHFYTEQEYEEEFRITRNGDTRWLRNKAFPIKDEHGNIHRIAGIAQDITLQRHTQDQKFSLAIERERVRVLKDFISDASHDLKTPISSIKLKAFLIEAVKDEAQRSKHISALNEQADKLNVLIDNLFTLSNLENLDELTLVTMSVNVVVNEVFESLQAIAQEKQVALHVDLERQPMPDILANHQELARALGNLVSNGIRYTYAEGEVRIQTRYQFERIIVKISDTGIGIHPEELEQIFNRFYRAKTATSNNIEGSGLGLAIVKRVITRHHGEIQVESTPGKGTTFTISLPPADHFKQF
ncbi:MAG: ATP-binding protein [Aggregatilineales bacterium]